MENKLWKLPPKIKLYEALGAVADGRIISDYGIKVYSSDRTKSYTVKYDEKSNAIMTNDNGSYWQGYLGYPAIAYLMQIKKLPLNKLYSDVLKDIPWKKINTEFKNDFDKTVNFIDDMLIKSDINIKDFHNYINTLLKELTKMKLVKLGKRQLPPK